MADLGDISVTHNAPVPDTALALTIPAWPDVSVTVPPPTGGGSSSGIPGSVTFS